jgi:hypothetical protein
LHADCCDSLRIPLMSPLQESAENVRCIFEEEIEPCMLTLN